LRQEHEPTDGQDTRYRAVPPAENVAAHGDIGDISMTVAGDAAQDDVTETGAVVALTRLLVAPLPPRSALSQALALGTRLLPCMRSLALYTIFDGTHESLTLVGRVERQHDSLDITAQALWQPRTTLGHGNELDQRVLDEHTTSRARGVTAVPLRSAEAGWVGVLVVEEQNQAHARERHPMLDVLAHCLTVLLERHVRNETATEDGRARDEFISLAAHELRNPLAAVTGYAQLLVRQARKHVLPDAMLRSIAAIEQQSLRMSEMIGELLDASRIRRGTLEVQAADTDLIPLARKVIAKRQGNAPRHTIALRIETPSLVGCWDGLRVEQILRDLLDNAVRFSPDGGPIFVRLATSEGMALVSVRDEGIGIEPEDQPHIFEYLYRAPSAEERNQSGLGLGLYICWHLAERMGGRLVLHETRTENTHGSELHLLLPLPT